MTTTTTMLDIESQINGANGGLFVKNLLTDLENDQFQLKRRLDSGLSPNEFIDTEKAFKAVEAAINVLNSYAKEKGAK